MFSKYLKFLMFSVLFSLLLSNSAWAQLNLGYGAGYNMGQGYGFSSGYFGSNSGLYSTPNLYRYNNLQNYSNYFNALPGIGKGLFAFDQAVGVLGDINRDRQRARALRQRNAFQAEQLENQKSRMRLQQGVPLFNPVAPNGRPRNPSITWDDVDSIR